MSSSRGSSTQRKRHIETSSHTRSTKRIISSHMGSTKLKSEDSEPFESSESSEGQHSLPVDFVQRYDSTKSRDLLARMIMSSELPFQYGQWFNHFMTRLNPCYEKVGTKSVKNECMKVFQSEKAKLQRVLNRVEKISLTCDFWTSNQTRVYMFLTAHYIDSDWNLQKRKISIIEVSPPYNGETILEAIFESLPKWGIQDKIGTITLKNEPNNDSFAGLLKSNFEEKGKLNFQGLFFHVKCYTQMLHSIIQDGLKKISCFVSKIRQGLYYLKKSQERLLKFGEIANQLNIPTSESLWTDRETRWDSTHQMVVSAIHYKTVFNEYALKDSDFEWCPTELEWENAKTVCDILYVFKNAWCRVEGTKYPTSNLFLMETFEVKDAIDKARVSTDSFSSEMGRVMHEKFDKYWDETSLLMAIASVLDPRYKIKLAEYCFTQLYSSDEVNDRIKKVTEKMHALFEIYAKDRVSSSSSLDLDSGKPMKNAFYNFVRSQFAQMSYKSELENYLEEPVLLEFDEIEYDVLDWWKNNGVRYLILSELARDVLCIPFSVALYGSDFEERVLNDYKSALSIDLLEVLVCGGDWVRAGYDEESSQEAEMEERDVDLEVKIPSLAGTHLDNEIDSAAQN